MPGCSQPLLPISQFLSRHVSPDFVQGPMSLAWVIAHHGPWLPKLPCSWDGPHEPVLASTITQVDVGNTSRKTLISWKKEQTSDSSLLPHFTYLEYSYDVWNSGSQLVTMRQSPRKLQRCQHQGDKPTSSYLPPEFLIWEENKLLLV